MLHLIVVNGVKAYCESIASTLDRHDEVHVLGAFAGQSEAINGVADLHPDAVIIDVTTGEDLDTVRALAERRPDARIIAMAVTTANDKVVRCAQAGVGGYVPVDCSLSDLANEVLAAYRGELRCPVIAGELMSAVSNRCAEPTEPVPDGLTPRELQVVGLIEKGFSNKEIAVELGLGVSTIKHHVHSILHKLQIRRRGQVASRTRGVRVDPPA